MTNMLHHVMRMSHTKKLYTLFPPPPLASHYSTSRQTYFANSEDQDGTEGDVCQQEAQMGEDQSVRRQKRKFGEIVNHGFTSLYIYL